MTSPTISRRSILSGATALALLGLGSPRPAQAFTDMLGGLLPSEPPATLHVGLVDTSASSGSDPSALYRDALHGFLGGIRSGDHILLAGVGEDRRVIPQRFAVAETGNSLMDQRAIKVAREDAGHAIEALIAAPKAQKTRLLETMALLKPYLSDAEARKMAVRICVASDGVEASDLADFARASGKQLDSLLSKLTENDMLITAQAARATGQVVGEILFCGTGGLSVERDRTIEQFWRGYAQAAALKMTFFGRGAPIFSHS